MVSSFIYVRYKLKYDVVASEWDTKTTGAFADSISNHSSIQLFTGQEYEKTRVNETIEDQRKATVFNWYLWEGFGALGNFYSVIVEFVIF